MDPLSGCGRDLPDITVFPGENATINGDRKVYRDGWLIPFLFLLHDLGEIAHHKRQAPGHSLTGRDEPPFHAEDGIGGDFQAAPVVPGIVLPALRGGLVDHRSFKPDPWNLPDQRGCRQSRVHHMEAGFAVEKETAHSQRNHIPALTSGREHVGSDGRLRPGRDHAQETAQRDEDRFHVRGVRGSGVRHWTT